MAPSCTTSRKHEKYSTCFSGNLFYNNANENYRKGEVSASTLHCSTRPILYGHNRNKMQILSNHARSKKPPKSNVTRAVFLVLSIGTDFSVLFPVASFPKLKFINPPPHQNGRHTGAYLPAYSQVGLQLYSDDDHHITENFQDPTNSQKQEFFKITVSKHTPPIYQRENE